MKDSSSCSSEAPSKVLTRSVLGWQPLGRQVTITAMDGNMVIKELDHIAVNFYEKYLKIDPSVDFDKKTLSFSLVVEKTVSNSPAFR